MRHAAPARARAAVLLLAGLLLGAAPGPPRRIMSLDQCDDVLLLMLVPRGRIASVTYLAHEAVAALLPPGADAGVAINHGSAEEIVSERPDLIVGTAFSAGAARRLATRAGVPLLEVKDATSFADIRATLRRVGAAVGASARAEALVARMDGMLARLAATRPRQAWRVVAWGGGGTVPGRGTLADAIMVAAGADDIAAARASGAGSFDLEQLLAARPDAVLQGRGGYDAPSIHRASARHPLIDRAFAGRQIDYPEAAFACGLPQSADAAVALRAALERLPARAPGW